MIVGPSKIFFTDEISNGLNSSTTFQIIYVLQHSVHIMETTLLVSLLKPAPEIFNLFDEIIIMAEGRIIYHGPRDCVFEFFWKLWFRVPRKEEPFWFPRGGMCFMSSGNLILLHFFSIFTCVVHVSFFLGDFEERSSAILGSLLRACTSRDWLLMKRNLFLYVFKLIQVNIISE